MSTATTTPTRYEQYAARVLARGYDDILESLTHPLHAATSFGDVYRIGEDDDWRGFWNDASGLPATLRGAEPERVRCEACRGKGTEFYRRDSDFATRFWPCRTCTGDRAVDPLDAIARELVSEAAAGRSVCGIAGSWGPGGEGQSALVVMFGALTPKQLAMCLWRAGLTHRLTADDVARLEGERYESKSMPLKEVNNFLNGIPGIKPTALMRRFLVEKVGMPENAIFLAPSSHAWDRQSDPIVFEWATRDRRIYAPGGTSPVGAMIALCEVEADGDLIVTPPGVSYSMRRSRVPLVTLAEHRDWSYDDAGNALDGRREQGEYLCGRDEWTISEATGECEWVATRRAHGGLLTLGISRRDEVQKRLAAQCNYVGAPGNPDATLPAGRLVLACSGRELPRP